MKDFKDKMIDRFNKTVVLCDDTNKIHILIHRISENDYMSLMTGTYGTIKNFDPIWVIKPGDRAEFSDDNNDGWEEHIYKGFNSQDIPFKSDCFNWRYIRPVQKNPELTKAMNDLEDAKALIKDAQERIKKLQKG